MSFAKPARAGSKSLRASLADASMLQNESANPVCKHIFSNRPSWDSSQPSGMAKDFGRATLRTDEASERFVEVAPCRQQVDVARRPRIDRAGEHRLAAFEDKRIVTAGEHAAEEPVEIEGGDGPARVEGR